MRPFFGVPIDWPLFRRGVHTHVRHFGQPPGRNFIEMLQRAERAAAQQAASEDRSPQVELEGASEAQLADEAKRSREETAELRKATEEARRDFEP